jgi:hypothetical protein
MPLTARSSMLLSESLLLGCEKCCAPPLLLYSQWNRSRFATCASW